MENEPAIVVENLVKTYRFGRVKALAGVNLQVNQGDIFGLIGPNGAGKTTLMGCMLALLRPTSGTISVFGKPPDHIDVRRITGFLPERPSYDVWMTASQFLHFHYRLSGQPTANAKAAVLQSLERVELSQAARRKISDFSRGMLQRLGLAQALIGKPEICFLDEPTSGMDPLGMELVRDVLLELKKQGTTAVVNSHHLDEVERTCNRFAFIRHGRIEMQEAVAVANEKVLVLRLAKEVEQDALAQLVGEVGASLIDFQGAQAKIAIPERKSVPEVIALLCRHDVKLEEVFFEKSSLSDLFKNLGKQPSGKPGDSSK
jgi:ABC-2 type transport system ATP-binding protein